MPTGNAAPHPADDTLIDHLAHRLGRVRTRLGPIEAIPDGEARTDAMSVQDDAVNAIKLLIPTTPARTLFDAALQLALACRACGIGTSTTDEEESQQADTMVMRLVAPVPLRLLDIADVRVDPASRPGPPTRPGAVRSATSRARCSLLIPEGSRYILDKYRELTGRKGKSIMTNGPVCRYFDQCRVPAAKTREGEQRRTSA
jgi:hypothetical protein